MTGNDLIKISFLNGKAMVFSSEDYTTLRSKHRIVGKLVGIPACYQRNMLWNSMPVCFSEYETKLLVEQGLVTLEDKSGLKELPCVSVKKEFTEHQEKIITELQKPYVESRLEGIRNNMQHIIRGKRKKLLKTGMKESEISLTPENILSDEANRIRQSLGNKSIYTQVPTQHPFHVNSKNVLDVTVRNDRKYKIFRDLWLKGGFFITGGDSFGCDFLTYPGDPMYYHASQIIHVIDSNQQFDAKFLISCARLSVSVNKKCVFAYVNDDETVTYQTLHWDNPKLRQIYTNDKPETSQSCQNSKS